MVASAGTESAATLSGERIASPATAPRPRSLRRWLFTGLGITVALVLAFVGYMAIRMFSPPPSDLDLSTTRQTAQGLYRVSYEPAGGAIRVNQIHGWTLLVQTPDGQPVENATITVDGGMPQHGHGLPTKPRVTGYLGDGRYQVEGMKFQMGGWWVVDFDITAAGQHDSVRFNFILN